jgi:hypothetical protein
VLWVGDAGGRGMGPGGRHAARPATGTDHSPDKR